jgi:hypothetical protein
MTFPIQKSLGDFIRERHGANWVYAARTSPDLLARHYKPDKPVAVITPKMQRQLAADYAKVWGREYDVQFWKMLCALRATEAMLRACGFQQSDAYAMVAAALEDATTPRRFT